MSLEDAIRRRVRLGQSFCSYSFKTVKKMKGQTFINAQRNHSYLSNHKTTKFIETAETIYLSASRLKSTARPSSNPQQKQNEPKLITKTPSIKQPAASKLSLHSIHRQTKQKVNKMQEYLSDFYELRSDFEFRSNKYENIPKVSHKYKHNSATQNKVEECIRPFFDKYLKIQAKQVAKKQFNSVEMPQLFYDFSLGQNCVQLPFSLLRLVSLQNGVYMEQSIGEKVFSEIPIKQYCHILNNFATNLHENIFYLALSKDKLQDQSLPYTECFFWISKPIKHTQRTPTLNTILKFYTKCVKQLSLGSICPKIWIVDYNGRISYMNRQEIEKYMQDPDTNQAIKYSQVFKNSQISQVCLSMFLASMKRGNFSSIRDTTQSKFLAC